MQISKTSNTEVIIFFIKLNSESKPDCILYELNIMVSKRKKIRFLVIKMHITYLFRRFLLFESASGPCTLVNVFVCAECASVMTGFCAALCSLQI